MGTKSRKTYTPEYRREAARLVIDTGRTVATVAREIGVGEQLLGRWVHAERARTGGGGEAPLDLDERAELERLRREIQELRMDNEFLGKIAPESPNRPDMGERSEEVLDPSVRGTAAHVPRNAVLTSPSIRVEWRHRGQRRAANMRN